MSKVLISNLGTGNKDAGGYRTAKYEFNGIIQEDTSVAKVLSTGLRVDRIFLFGTTGSIWDWAYKAFGGVDEEFKQNLCLKQKDSLVNQFDICKIAEQIRTYLESDLSSCCFLIKYGINDVEIRENFGLFVEAAKEIQDGDEIYLDITHSFRSLALMSYVMIDYMKAIGKKIVLSGIYYGMVEVKETIKPIVNLLSLFEFGQWSRALNYFHEYGNPHPLSDLINQHYKSNSKLRNEYRNFSQAYSLGYLMALQPNICNYSPLPDTGSDVLQDNLNHIINQTFEDFSSIDEIQFLMNLSQFYAKTHNYGLSYLALQCAIEDRILTYLKVNSKYEGKFVTKTIKAIIIALSEDPGCKELFKIRSEVSKIRNKIAHCLPNKNVQLGTYITKLEQYIEKSIQIMKQF